MTIPNEELDYSHHVAFYEGLGHLNGEPEHDAFWHRKAEYMHALSVMDATRDAHLEVAALSQKEMSVEAQMQLRFGVARRTKFIWLSLRDLIGAVMPERIEPLPHDEVEEAARDINVIYINIRGAMDNFAWALIELFGSDATKKLPPQRVGLLQREVLRDPGLDELREFLRGFSEWHSDFKERRDPAAHRIPLSIPPAILDDASYDEYAAKKAEYDDAVEAALRAVREGSDDGPLFERADALHGELERIGTFVPVFTHHPDEGGLKIYPVVPQDIAELVKINRKVCDFISVKLEPNVEE